ncbi:MAG: type II toxin-antitoxin system RelB/DinJ family antitoxin [Salinivirgaceae bacterium]|nr:type II toxin-antitoxin system RelB/DinJ family antitoxin [Salinivirgaceae bacterium]
MAQVSMTVRMDSQLKAKFDELCSQFGMSANTAMNVFASAVVRKRKIPFEVEGEELSAYERGWNAFHKIRQMAEAGQLPQLTDEEINEEIRLYRAGK